MSQFSFAFTTRTFCFLQSVNLSRHSVPYQIVVLRFGAHKCGRSQPASTSSLTQPSLAQTLPTGAKGKPAPAQTLPTIGASCLPGSASAQPNLAQTLPTGAKPKTATTKGKHVSVVAPTPVAFVAPQPKKKVTQASSFMRRTLRSSSSSQS